MKPLKVLSVTSELYPLIKTGGLADVAGALPLALQAQGVEMRTLLPGYPAVMAALKNAHIVHHFRALFGGKADVLSAEHAGLRLYVLDAPHLYNRPGNPYLQPDGMDWHDNALRFAALARVGADIGKGLLKEFTPHIVHCHDWQAALVPVYLHFDGGKRPKTIITVHNLAFQGRFKPDILQDIGLPAEANSVEAIEYFGDLSFLKGGLQFADWITTVSPTYAREIRLPDAGMGMDGILRTKLDRTSGILNGIDTNVWNPETDTALPAPFSAKKLSLRAKSKAALQKRLGLTPDKNAQIFGVISRLSSQKGLDLLLEALPALLLSGGQLALLGAGDTGLEQGFRAAQTAYPGQIACVIGYDESLAHLIQAGSDALLVPSRFEPCGLTQLCALRYGAIPVVARVGGLNDTIIEANEMALNAGVATGIQFSPVTVPNLIEAIRRAAQLYADTPRWKQMQHNAMKTDVSWDTSARAYAQLYHQILN
jgi:starch synthase